MAETDLSPPRRERSVRRPFFLTARDEATFSSALQAATPGIRFVDGQRWPTADPPLVASIDGAQLTEVLLWDSVNVPILPSAERSSGDYQGPISGPVIQFERSRLIDGELRSGSIAWAAVDGTPAAAFARRVMRTLQKLTAADGITVDGIATPYWIGADARRWALAAPHHRLRDRSVLALYVRLRSDGPGGPTHEAE